MGKWSETTNETEVKQARATKPRYSWRGLKWWHWALIIGIILRAIYALIGLYRG